MMSLAMARQESMYLLMFDEFLSALGRASRDFGSMNMDKLLCNIWSVKRTKGVLAATTPAESWGRR
jgi:ABA responsive element binding factor